MILIINSSELEGLLVALADQNKIVIKVVVKAKFAHEEKLLNTIDKLLRLKKIKLTKLTGLIVVSGPGSFSALRIGLAVANTIAWQLNIPIVGISKELFGSVEELYKLGKKYLSRRSKFSLVLPFYNQAPNINIKNKI